VKRKLMGRMLNKNVFPQGTAPISPLFSRAQFLVCFGAGQQDSSGYSLQRRGGRAIEKMMPKDTKVGADGVVSP